MMRALLHRAELRSTLRLIEPLVVDRPERARVAVDVLEGVVRISTTDGEQVITATCPAFESDPGVALVPGRVLLEFVRTAVDDRVCLQLSPEGLELFVVSGDASIALMCYPVDAWRPPAECSGPSTTWDAATIRQLGRVTHAASNDLSRPALRGISLADGWAAATDAYRLAAARLPTPTSTEALVPVAAINALVRAYSSGEVLVRFQQGRVSFELGGTVITSTLIVESFPDWRPAVSRNGAQSLLLDRQSVLAALDRMSVLAAKELMGTLTFVPDGNRVLLECRVPELGRQEDHVEGASTMPSVSFKLAYLRAAIEQAHSDPVVLAMNGPTSPALLTEEDYIALVLPIRA